MFCSACKAEYRSGFTICSDCHIALVHELPTLPTGNLEIYRESHLSRGLRSYSILVDGEKVGSIKNGTTSLIPLAPGPHSVLIKIDWIKSNTMDINTKIGTTIKLQIGYKKRSGWKAFALSGICIATALIGVIFGIGYLVGIGVAGFIGSRVGKLYLRQEQET